MTSVAVMYGELHNIQSTTCSGKVGHTTLWDSACTIQSCGKKSDPASKATIANTAIVSSRVRQMSSFSCSATRQLHMPTCDRHTMFGLNRRINLYVFGFQQHDKLWVCWQCIYCWFLKINKHKSLQPFKKSHCNCVVFLMVSWKEGWREKRKKN